MSTFGSSRRILLFLVLCAALLRLPGLNSGLWFDEIWTLVDQIRAPLSQSVFHYESDNNHPLYSLCAWLSVRLFGESPWALRLPAFLFGVASVPALFFFGRRLVSERVALFACTLLVVSHHHVAYSQNARAYTMLLFFTLVSCQGFLGALEGAERRPWILQGVALGLATYAHLTAVFLALAQLLVWLTFGLRGSERTLAPLRGLLLATSFSLLLHGPMLGEMMEFFLGSESAANVDAEWTNPLWTLTEIARSAGLGGPLALIVAGLGALVALIGLVTIARRSPAGAALCVLPTLLGGVTLVLLGRNLWPRFFFFCAGFYLLVGCAGLARPYIVHNRKLALAGGLVLVLALATRLPGTWSLPKQDFEGAQEWLAEQHEPGDVVVTLGLARFPFESFYETDYVPVDSVASLESAIAPATRAFALSTFPIFLASRQPQLADWLAEHGKEVQRFRGWMGDGDVVLFSLRAGE